MQTVTKSKKINKSKLESKTQVTRSTATSNPGSQVLVKMIKKSKTQNKTQDGDI